MNRFAGAFEAKEFLVASIVEEARREGVPVSEIERKMLYFSETAGTSPGISEAREVFDGEHDQDEYEKKIERLIRNLRTRAREEHNRLFDAWPDAIRALRNEDHYLLVMIRQADAGVRPPGDLLKLWGSGLAIVCVGVLVVFCFSAYVTVNLTREEWRFFLWAAAACAIGFYLLFCLFLGRSRTDELLIKAMSKLFTPFNRSN
jgi:hypothetical protein